jgi:hypothetical protein
LKASSRTSAKARSIRLEAADEPVFGRATAETPRAAGGSAPTEPAASPTEARAAAPVSSASEEAAMPQETVVAEPLAVDAPRPAGGVSPASPRFRIFILDPGWDSPAHRVLQANFGLLRELQKDDPIYVLGREKSIEFLRHHQERIGREPIIAVHDLAELGKDGTPDPDFHGFRLHLGLMRTHKQALMALQNFVRFLATHRQSVDLEADIRSDLRREGLAGAIEIILHHEAREIGE